MPPRPLLPATRLLLVAFSVLTLLAFGVLFLRSEATELSFAWTVEPPLTAAFLGAGYGAGCVLVLLALRERAWANARLPVVTILVFTLLTLLATLLHLDRFHFAGPGPLARLAAWFWLTVYLAVPVALLALVPLQERQAGADLARRRPLPAWLAGTLAVQGAVLLALGAALYAAPGAAARLWPWPLTPLTARAVAAWLLAFGVAAVLALRERDLGRLRIAAVAYALFGMLQLLALARYPGEVRGDDPRLWIYLGLLLSVVAAGARGWWGAHGRTAHVQ
jgi:hypothetical protein